MTSSKRIDIAGTHGALIAQNGKLHNTRARMIALRRTLDFDRSGLTGQGYDAMWRYCHYALIPLVDAIISAMDAQMRANDCYHKAVGQYLPWGGVMNLDALIKQREAIQRRINELEGKRQFYSSFMNAHIINGMIDRQIAPLVRTRNEINKRINGFLDLLYVTSNVYDEAKARKSRVNELLAAAQEGWSPGVGYSAAYKATSISIGVPLWTDTNNLDINASGDPITYRYINGVKTEYGTVYSNNYDGTVACTYYTLTRLRERGLDFPFLGSGHAKTWFANCGLDSQYKAVWEGGKNPIEVLLDRFEYSELTNVVIVFPGAGPTSETGHVLLIDRVYHDAGGELHVVWSDIADPNGGNPPIFNRKTVPGDEDPSVDRTLGEFMSLYPARAYGMMTGAVLFGG